MHRLLLTLFVLGLMGGCGLKGPLYLPESKPEPKPAVKSSPPPKPSPAPIERGSGEVTP